MLLGLADRLFLAYVRDTTIPARFTATFGGLYAFLLHKWYFDELYDLICSCAPHSRLAASCGSVAMSGHDRPLRSGRHLRAGRRRWGAHASAPVGLCLYLCAGDADRPLRGGDLGGGALEPMNGFPILSIMILVPVLAAGWCLFAPGEEACPRQPGALDRTRSQRWSTSCSVSLLWVNYDVERCPVAVRGAGADLRSLQPGRSVSMASP